MDSEAELPLHTCQGAPAAIVLPPKQRFQLSAKRSHEEAAAGEAATAAATASGGASEAQQEAEGEELLGAPPRPGGKQLKLSTSKILGVAQPRRPRVGPEFQAVVPEWPAAAPCAGRSAPPPQPMQE